MNATERIAYVKKKAADRKKIQDKISALNVLRSEFLAVKQKENSNNASLDNAMLSAISKQAKAKNFTF